MVVPPVFTDSKVRSRQYEKDSSFKRKACSMAWGMTHTLLEEVLYRRRKSVMRKVWVWPPENTKVRSHGKCFSLSLLWCPYSCIVCPTLLCNILCYLVIQLSLCCCVSTHSNEKIITQVLQARQMCVLNVSFETVWPVFQVVFQVVLKIEKDVANFFSL